MDKIKEIRIKEKDGSLSDILPIGADAKNVEMANGNSVEDEINNKVSKNTLNSLNKEVELLESRVNNLSSLEEGSTTGDAELQDIRVGGDGVTYDTAGTAVRTQIVNNVNAIKFLNNNLKTKLVSGDYFEGQFFNYKSGNYENYNSAYYFKVSVTQGEIYKIKTYGQGVNLACIILFNNTTPIKNIGGYVGDTTKIIEETVIIPNGVNYLMVQGIISSSFSDFYIKKITSDLFVFEPSTDYEILEGKFYNKTNTLVEDANYNTVLIPIRNNDENIIKFDGKYGGGSVYDFSFLNNEKGIVSKGYYASGTTENTLIVPIPTNSTIKYVGVIVHNNYMSKIKIHRLVKEFKVFVANLLQDKKMMVIGDSKTEGDTGNGNGITKKPWTYYIPLYTGLSKCDNYGKCGTKISGTQDSSFINRLNNITEENYDITCIYGGINDFGQDTPLGTINDTDITTFYGALNTLIYNIIEKYPNAILFFITPQKQVAWRQADPEHKNGLGLTLGDYVQAIYNVCDKFSVPVLDFYKYGGITGLVPAQKNLLMNDGIHETEQGYERTARRISAFIRTLM